MRHIIRILLVAGFIASIGCEDDKKSSNGSDESDGQNSQGEQGPAGPKGDKGDLGPIGPKGDKGDLGDPGPDGPSGADGVGGFHCWDLDMNYLCDLATEDIDADDDCDVDDCQGPVGPQGVQGVQGDKGDKGDQGDKGDKGDKGDQGDQGDPGNTGLPGAPGLNCWDLNANNACDVAEEDVQPDGDCNVDDCVGDQGLQGTPGAAGLACWDLDSSGTCDLPGEDVDGNNDCDVDDCRGEQGAPGLDAITDTDVDGVPDWIEIGCGTDHDNFDEKPVDDTPDGVHDCLKGPAGAGIDPSGDLNIDGKITATGSIQAGGCYGAVYVGITSYSTYGTEGDGYAGMNVHCNNEFAGSHLCTSSEILNSINCGAVMPTSGSGWVSVGIGTNIRNLSGAADSTYWDCQGWTYDQVFGDDAVWVYGAVFEFQDTRGSGASSGLFLQGDCYEDSHNLVCCK